MPDYFVAEDTTTFTPYYEEVATKGLISQFCFNYSDANRKTLAKLSSADEIAKHLRQDKVVQQFIEYCDSKGIKRRNNMILRSQPLLESVIYGNIIYSILEIEDYLKYINRNDATVNKAIELFRNGLTKPQLTPANDKAGNKKTAHISMPQQARSRYLA